MAIKISITSIVLVPVASFLVAGFLCYELSGQNSFEFEKSDEKIVAIVFSNVASPCFEKPENCFQIRVVGQTQNILGEWKVANSKLKFSPIFTFSPGVTYHMFYQENQIGEFTLNNLINEQNLKLNVYPTRDTLPANLLKMYFQFSEPMKELPSKKYVTMINDEGDTLKDVFLGLQPELWNADGTRLTLWIDPGRVKRHLKRNKMLGTPFMDGKSYRLRVSMEWESKNGNTLSDVFEKQIVIKSEDRYKPEVSMWQLSEPMPDTKDPLIIDFGESMDYALLMESFELNSLFENTITGTFYFSKDETRLSFVPLEEWVSGDYQLVIDARLEDLTGNNLNRLFDQDLEKGDISISDQNSYMLKIAIK